MANYGVSRLEPGRSATSVARVEELGIVGAGGGGFPTAVKLKTQVPLVIANAAECEPLLHKDKELLLHFGAEMLAGLRTAMDRVGARRGIIGIKEKYEDVIRTLAPLVANDMEIWQIAAFVKQLPDVSDADYKAWVEAGPPPADPPK